MTDYLSVIENRLSADDKKQLADIYEPTVVAVPDADAFHGLTVTKDGAIRFYGMYRRASVFDTRPEKCYLESLDGGLSWKRHIIPDSRSLPYGTAAFYLPFCERYIRFYSQEGEGTFALISADADGADVRRVTVSHEYLFDLRPPLVLRTGHRILVTACETRPHRHPTAFYPVVLYSDDAGDSWRVVKLGEAPMFEKTWPHKGMRWEQNNREATVAELSDGSLLLISRTSTDFHYMSRSFDGGETWSDFAPTAFHSTGTMPCLYRLSDGRLLFFWCNTQPLPELEDADGVWEDVFTNRDASHCAISSDDGKTWRGFRELYLNPLRCASDFRSHGGPECDRDKSVHQFEVLELPMNKLLVVCGQHTVCRRILIFDLDWLYETTRKEDFIHGLASLSTQTYVKSILGGYLGQPDTALEYAGHCAYNRTHGALLLPSPEQNGKEALHITYLQDDRLVSCLGGAVWNFPIAIAGRVTLCAYLPGKGLRVSLLDHWMNPCDETVSYYADASVVLSGGDGTADPRFSVYTLDFDCESGTLLLLKDGKTVSEHPMRGDCPNGLCYLHLQTAAAAPDASGSYVSRIEFTGTRFR